MLFEEAQIALAPDADGLALRQGQAREVVVAATLVGSIVLLQENAEKMIYEKYRELYLEEKACHFLLYEDDTVVACGGALIKEDVPFCFFKTPMYGYIIDVYTIPEKRRNGYASKIMEELLKWLKGKGIQNIKLKPSSTGKQLYEKLGFYDSGEMEIWIYRQSWR